MVAKGWMSDQAVEVERDGLYIGLEDRLAYPGLL
jgi:hypothetical protein